MELYVDECECACECDENTTLHQALESIRKENAEKGRAILGLFCDGRDALTDLTQGMLDEPANSFERIDVQTGSPTQLIAQALREARETLEDAERSRREIVELLGAGQTGQAVTLLGSCLGQWWQTNEAISKSLAMLGVIGEAAEGAWEELSSALDPVTTRLADIRDAVQAQDFVSLADILEYEFADVTEAWNNVIETVLKGIHHEPTEQHDDSTSAGRLAQFQPGEPATSRDPDVNPL